ncbi:MAG: MIP/aquaporin family protein [Candidatus Eisenbacteria bacterium]
MNKYLAEFIGTFFLVLTVGCTVIAGGSGVIPPLAIGSALMVMVYATGHISGGHLNPAVTLGVFLRGKLPAGQVVPYWISQVLGALVATLVVRFFKGADMGTVTPMVPAVGPAFLAELLFTFALVWVVLNSATAKGTSGNSFYGLAIGFTVLTGAFAVGGISGGAFNPAVAVGVGVLGVVAIGSIWVHIVAELLAAVLAAFAFKFANGPEA